jgi:hypothetical protein
MQGILAGNFVARDPFREIFQSFLGKHLFLRSHNKQLSNNASASKLLSKNSSFGPEFPLETFHRFRTETSSQGIFPVGKLLRSLVSTCVKSLVSTCVKEGILPVGKLACVKEGIFPVGKLLVFPQESFLWENC